MTAHLVGDGPGLPYAKPLLRGNAQLVTCPACGRVVHLHDRKDEESFSRVEYAEHWTAQAVAEGRYHLVDDDAGPGARCEYDNAPLYSSGDAI